VREVPSDLNKNDRSYTWETQPQKKYPYKKKRDMFLLFFGVIGGSTNAIDWIFISMA
jgi:hypothetical protein